MVIVGVCYKIAAVPFHFYTPDVYQGAATPVTAYLAYAPKAAGMIAIISTLTLIEFNYTGTSGTAIMSVLTVLSVLTMTVGNVLALLQRNVKRIFAYSSIAHSGYMLVGLVAGPAISGGVDGVDATLFYLASYAIMNLGAFAVLIYLQGKADAAEDLDDLAGVAKEHPAAAMIFALCLFSLIGMPLTVGFLGKLYLIEAVLSTGHTTLAIIVVINAAIAAAYYLKIIASMYLREALYPFVVRTAMPVKATAIVCAVGGRCVLLPALGADDGERSQQHVSGNAASDFGERSKSPGERSDATIDGFRAISWLGDFPHFQRPQFESRILPKKPRRIVVKNSQQRLHRMPPPPRFQIRPMRLQRIAHPPIRRRIHAKLLGPVNLHHVHRPLRRAFAHGVNGHPRPIPRILHKLDRVFLNMVNQNSPRIERRPKVIEHFKNHPRPLQLVLQMRRVNQNQMMLPRIARARAALRRPKSVDRQLHMLLKNLRFIGRVLIQSDFANAQHRRPRQKLRNLRQHFARLPKILRLLGIETNPRIMLNPKLRRPLRFRLRQLPIVINKPRRRPVIPRPKRGLRDGSNAGDGHVFIVRGRVAKPCGSVDQ